MFLSLQKINFAAWSCEWIGACKRMFQYLSTWTLRGLFSITGCCLSISFPSLSFAVKLFLRRVPLLGVSHKHSVEFTRQVKQWKYPMYLFLFISPLSLPISFWFGFGLVFGLVCWGFFVRGVEFFLLSDCCFAWFYSKTTGMKRVTWIALGLPCILCKTWCLLTSK